MNVPGPDSSCGHGIAVTGRCRVVRRPATSVSSDGAGPSPLRAQNRSVSLEKAGVVLRDLPKTGAV